LDCCRRVPGDGRSPRRQRLLVPSFKIFSLFILNHTSMLRYVSKPWISGALSLDNGLLSIRSTSTSDSFKVSVNQLHCVAHHPLDTAISLKSPCFRHFLESDSASAPPSPIFAIVNVDFASVQAVDQWSFLLCNAQESLAVAAPTSRQVSLSFKYHLVTSSS
jgi:hypothetical protein